MQTDGRERRRKTPRTVLVLLFIPAGDLPSLKELPTIEENLEGDAVDPVSESAYL